jgi:hypothetical protein
VLSEDAKRSVYPSKASFAPFFRKIVAGMRGMELAVDLAKCAMFHINTRNTFCCKLLVASLFATTVLCALLLVKKLSKVQVKFLVAMHLRELHQYGQAKFVK